MAKKKEPDIAAEVRDSAHKIWLAGLGALAAAEEEGSKLFRNLVERGEGFESRGREQFDKVRDRVKDASEKVREATDRVKDATGKAGSTFERFSESFDDRVSGALHRLGVPTQDEIEKLTRRIEELTAKLDRLKNKD